MGNKINSLYEKNNIKIPEAVYESMLKVFIRRALEKQKHVKNLGPVSKKQGITTM